MKHLQAFELREDIRTVPNLLTLSRIVLTPAIGWLIVQGSHGWALLAFGVAGFTDLLDGWIARRFSQQTILGTVLDPAADKILMTTLTISLWWGALLPGWLTVLIIGRDVGLVLGAFYVRWISLEPPKTLSRYWDVTLPSAEVRPTRVSKVNTAFQLALMGVSLASGIWDFQDWIGMDAFRIIVGTTTVWSGAQYLLANNSVKILRKLK
ncbi:CDP-diacylglycerol--glycerol-3-phosphate 3-phosphatidyltransferase [Gonapodya prolifera JEL478]|uniref:CDP-diacylglycerol--glycerol-3-phosphate 3-phosphatidyltransferase n=1 Tax=Gonapodya prolifera (strain JEL478) TaxID=1344416 RepID=A0A139ALC3_GONPJ|nr:CDP-diacylglycerol--glycerol-3-phosphate 3-phosphatidyltransferase [Gonapodya prolifera JEL478]|eukprot:KXS17550.1 CDP-diacylglycerol--glycerol-3-phosphate 3-phosphatidyltransferase [Gonapodya prolifera JEL478]